MAEGLRCRHACHLGQDEFAERPSRSGEQDLVDGVAAFAHQALEDGAVLAIDGEDSHAVLHCQPSDEFTSHHECFLVGQRNVLPGFDGGDSGAQSRKTDHRSEHDVDFAHPHHIAKGIVTGKDFHGQVGQRIAYRRIVGFVGNDHDFGPKLTRLCNEEFSVVAGGERIGLIGFGMLAHNVERLCPDGPG